MSMTLRYYPLIVLLSVTASHDSASQLTEPATLVINANTPVVEVARRSAGRRFIRLTSLDYKLELNAQCAAGFGPMALSISVADTRKSPAADTISAGGPISMTLTIPAPQISPIAIDNFCVEPGENPPLMANNQANGEESLEVKAALSVQASLLCANEIDKHMIYASKPLNVVLLCKVPDA